MLSLLGAQLVPQLVPHHKATSGKLRGVLCLGPNGTHTGRTQEPPNTQPQDKGKRAIAGSRRGEGEKLHTPALPPKIRKLTLT